MASQTDPTQLSQEDIDEQIRLQAEEIASAKVKELQTNITDALGEKKKGYSSFDEMQADIDRRAEEKAKTYAEKVKEELRLEREAEAEAAKQRAEAATKQTEEQQKKEWEQISAEWREAVADGIAPAVDDELAAKLKSGVKWEDLSEKEQNDPGLTFYNKARERHIELKKQGKAVSFYRTLSQMDRKPSGASAPVFGGSVATPSNDDDFEYDELHKATQEIFRIG